METHLNADPDNSVARQDIYVVHVKTRADRTKHGGGVIIMAMEDILCDNYPTEKYMFGSKLTMCSSYSWK